MAGNLEWHQKFKEGQGLDYASENKPYAESLEYNDVEGELAQGFMPDSEDPSHAQTDKVVRFCPRATLEALKRAKHKPVAWLEEGCFTKDGRWLARQRSEPLTAYDLFFKLGQPVRSL